MKLFKNIVYFCILCLPISIQAAEVNLSGFATLAGGLTLDDDESIEGYDDSFDFKPNSLLAIQASSDLGNGWGVTAQLLARGNEEWDINAEWAFISYDATDSWRLLFGRQRAPFYLYSDFLDVSYAYHWIKPPTGVYNLPFDTIDGIGSIYNSTLGDFDSTLHFSYGRNQDKFSTGGEEVTPDFSNFMSIAWTLNWEWLTLRLSYAQTDLSIPVEALQPLLGGWNGAGFTSVADSIEIKDDNANFAGIGVIIDYEDYLIVSEYTELDPGDNTYPQTDSFYVSFGKRFDNTLVHLTYGIDEGKGDLGLLNGVPAGVDPGLDFLIASTTGVMSGNNEDSSYISIGLRWEVSDSVAFKTEYTSFDNDLGSDASLVQFALTTVF